MVRRSAGGRQRCVILLRGINVGGRHRVPMASLVEILGVLGLENPVTYLQSGNALVTTAQPAEELASELSSVLDDRFGFEVPVVVRSSSQMARVAEEHPFVERAAALKQLHVVFLSSAPEPTAVAALDHARSATDAFEVRGAEVYLYLEHAARTTLSIPYFERTLGVQATMRNWLTVTALAELASADR